MKEKETAPWNDPNVRWVCEDHPEYEQGHRLVTHLYFGKFGFIKECGGAGMPEPTEENREKGYITNKQITKAKWKK